MKGPILLKMNQDAPAQAGISKDSVVRSDWYRELAKYEQPDLKKAAGQLLNTVLPYFGLWTLMVLMLKWGISYWFVFPLIVFASGFLIRIFIFFHDCCHGSFFASRHANRIVGYITGLLTFT